MLKKKKSSHPETPPPRRVEENSGHGGADHDESNWLVSYADMMTLLCGFFIMLFSMSKMDEPKYEKVKEALAKEFHGKYEAPNEALGKFVTQVIQEAGVEKDAVVKSDPLGVSVVFQSTVFFDTLGADVKSQGKVILDRLIGSIFARQQKEDKQFRIVVEGHTDSRPIIGGSFPSNWELSGARASRVVRMFLDHGFAPERLTSIGYADTRPAVEARTPAGAFDENALAKNRRVVLRILDPKVDSIPFPDAAKRLTETAQAPVQQARRAPANAVAPSPVPSPVPAPDRENSAH